MSVRFVIDFNRKKRLESRRKPVDEKGLFLQGHNGCSVILVHGLTGTPKEMNFLAKHLNQKGYSVLCPRLANHGQPIEILKNTTWQECYQSVRDAFLAITSINKNDFFFVSGLSIGALLALLLADEFKGMIAGVSCLSPILFYDGWNSPWCRHFLPLVYFAGLKNFFYFKEEPPYGIKNEAIRNLVGQYYKNASLKDMKDVGRYGYPYYPVALLYQHHILVKYLIKRLSSIYNPLQLIQAKNDDMSSMKNSQFIYDNVSSNVKDFVVLENSYHVVSVDQEKEKVGESLDRFFAAIGKKEKLTREVYALQGKAI